MYHKLRNLTCYWIEPQCVLCIFNMHRFFAYIRTNKNKTMFCSPPCTVYKPLVINRKMVWLVFYLNFFLFELWSDGLGLVFVKFSDCLQYIPGRRKKITWAKCVCIIDIVLWNKKNPKNIQYMNSQWIFKLFKFIAQFKLYLYLENSHFFFWFHPKVQISYLNLILDIVNKLDIIDRWQNQGKRKFYMYLPKLKTVYPYDTVVFAIYVGVSG